MTPGFDPPLLSDCLWFCKMAWNAQFAVPSSLPRKYRYKQNDSCGSICCFVFVFYTSECHTGFMVAWPPSVLLCLLVLSGALKG